MNPSIAFNANKDMWARTHKSRNAYKTNNDEFKVSYVCKSISHKLNH